MMNSGQVKHAPPLDSKQHLLYQQALLTHHQAPIGFNVQIAVTHSAAGVNHACGDEIRLDLQISKGHIQAISFHGDSCAICRASASLLCQHLHKQTIEQVHAVNQQIQAAFTDNIAIIGTMARHFSPLMAVQKFPVRKQCALLPWTTLTQALQAFE